MVTKSDFIRTKAKIVYSSEFLNCTETDRPLFTVSANGMRCCLKGVSCLEQWAQWTQGQEGGGGGSLEDTV